MQPTVAYLQARLNRHTYSQLEWSTNGALQLQRLAQEERGVGPWSRCIKYVPVCGADEILAGLDVSVPQHPTLRRSRVKLEDAGSPSPDPEKAAVQMIDVTKVSVCLREEARS